MQGADFRTQSTAPSTPANANTVVIYSNDSGILISRNKDSNEYQVGTQSINTIAMLGQTVSTGYARFHNNSANTYTGIFYGGTGDQTVPTLLGKPDGFLPFTSPSGITIAIPYYTRS